MHLIFLECAMNETDANKAGWDLYYKIKSIFGESIDKSSVAKAEGVGICASEKLFAPYFSDKNLIKASILHSNMLRLAIKIYKAHKEHFKDKPNTKFDIIGFMKLWDIENLRKDDYNPLIIDSNKEIPSLAIQTIRAVLQESVDTKDKASVLYYLPYINKIIDAKAENIIWAIFTRANAYMFLGNAQNAKMDRLAIVIDKRKQIWAWSDLAEVFTMTNEKDLEFSCYCKALSLVVTNKQEPFVIKTREKFADLLVERREFGAAKYELNKIDKCLKKNKWQIPIMLMAKIESSVFKEIESTKSNKTLYAKFIPIAEKLVFGNSIKTTK